MREFQQVDVPAKCGCWVTRDCDSGKPAANPLEFTMHPCAWHARWLVDHMPCKIQHPNGSTLRPKPEATDLGNCARCGESYSSHERPGHLPCCKDGKLYATKNMLWAERVAK